MRKTLCVYSVAKSCPTLWPHGLQHARLPCPSPSRRVCSNLCPLSRWCHPTISSCRPLLFMPSIFPSIRVFSSFSHQVAKYWSFSFSISPSNEYSGLVSFRMDWLDLLVVQGTLKSLLQHHSLKASVLQCSGFFTIQLSHPYTTTGKKHHLYVYIYPLPFGLPSHSIFCKEKDHRLS